MLIELPYLDLFVKSKLLLDIYCYLNIFNYTSQIDMVPVILIVRIDSAIYFSNSNYVKTCTIYLIKRNKSSKGLITEVSSKLSPKF